MIHMDFGQEKFKNSNLPRGKRMTVREQFFKTGIWPLGGVGVVQLFAYPTARVMTIKIKVFIENISPFSNRSLLIGSDLLNDLKKEKLASTKLEKPVFCISRHSLKIVISSNCQNGPSRKHHF